MSQDPNLGDKWVKIDGIKQLNALTLFRNADGMVCRQSVYCGHLDIGTIDCDTWTHVCLRIRVCRPIHLYTPSLRLVTYNYNVICAWKTCTSSGNTPRNSLMREPLNRDTTHCNLLIESRVVIHTPDCAVSWQDICLVTSAIFFHRR